MVGVKGKSGGHNRKTSATLKIEGGFRKGRHSARADLKQTSAQITPPPTLTGLGLECWNDIVATLPAEAITVADRWALAELGDWINIREQLMVVFQADPLDKNVRCAVRDASQAIDRLGRQFGWTPVSRAAIKGGSDEKEIDPFTQLAERFKTG